MGGLVSARGKLFTWERRDPGARVLQVTNMWPIQDGQAGPSGSPGPRYGIFVKRQIDSVIAAGVPCDVFFVRGFNTPLAYAGAAAFLLTTGLKERRYRIVHVHAGEAALPARFFPTAPVIVSYYGSDLLGKPRADGSMSLRSRVRRKLQRAHAVLATRTITQSREMERALPRRAQPRNLVLPSGIEPELFRPIPREVARKRLGWNPAERVALFAADPEVQRKRYWLAEAACNLAAAQVDGVRLRVAANVAPEEMFLVMNAADCLLLTSSIEGSPNVVKEAALCNLPVVTTRVGDVDEVLADVEPSWICDATPGELASALVDCLSSPRRSNGRQTRSWLNSETIARPILDLYEELAPGTVGGGTGLPT